MPRDRIGRYEIQRRLGTGGMGSLYLARDPGLDRLVAIKLLKDDYQDDDDLRERFAREARSVARLRHPNIIIVFDVGEDEGRPFMAMEYIAGETLTAVLRRDPPLPLVRRLGLMEELCAGLAHAHGAGVVHRDVKPANLMLDSEGVLKILDFGIARLGNSGMTQDGMMMGSVNYMSPEQIIGRGVDHRTDIFATGAVLYEAIALEQAFPGAIDSGVLHSILEKGPIPLDQRVPGIDPELVRIVQHALEREPEHRYDDVNVMRQDIARVRRRLLERGHDSAPDSPRDRTIVTRPKTATPDIGFQGESDRRRKMDPERFAEVRRQQVEEHLRFSREAFAQGDHEAALRHAERAASVDPDNRVAFDLIDQARLAIDARAVRQLLSEASRLLSEARLDDAAAKADQAAAAVPDLEGADELRNEARRVSDEIAAARERQKRIYASLLRAKTSMERGGYETALRAVYEVLALDPDSSEARDLEQIAKSKLQAQREHEQARRTAYDRLKAARTLADECRFDEAVDVINAVVSPSDTVRLAAADALASIKTLQRRRNAADAIVAEAHAALSEGQFEEAVSRIDSIAAEDLTDEARSLRATADQKLTAQRELVQRRQALEAAIAATQALIANGNIVRAYERLQDAVGIGLDDERIVSLRRQIGDLAAAAEARRREEARERAAARRVEAARQLFASGDGSAAVAMLEHDASGHQLVAAALTDMRAALAAEQERVRQEAEMHRREEEARRQAEIEAARLLEEKRQAAEKQRRDEERRLAEERRTAQEAAEKKRLEEERLREAEQREQRRRELENQLAEARERFDRDNLNAAREAAEAALIIDPQNTVALKIRQDIDQETQRRVAEAARQEEARKEEARRQAEQAQARRREEEARQKEQEARQREEEARQLEARRQAEQARRREEEARQKEQEARQREEEARQLEARRQAEQARRREEEARQKEQEARQREEEARQLEARRQAEQARRREEEARQKEQEARQREEEARKLDEQVTKILKKSRKVPEHEAALGLLNEALTLAPGDLRVQALLRERTAALENLRAEEQRRAEAGAREKEAAEEAAQRERERLARDREEREERARSEQAEKAALAAELETRRQADLAAVSAAAAAHAEHREATVPGAAQEAAGETVLRLPRPVRRRANIAYLGVAAGILIAVAVGVMLFQGPTSPAPGGDTRPSSATVPPSAPSPPIAPTPVPTVPTPVPTAPIPVPTVPIPAPTVPIPAPTVPIPAPTVPTPVPTVPTPVPTVPTPVPTVPTPVPTVPTPVPTVPTPVPTVPTPVPTVPTPVPTVPTPPIELPPPPRVDERAAIERTLRAYEAAWASLDPAAIGRVQDFTSADMARVRASIAAARQFQVSVQVQDIRLAADGRHATVTAGVRRVLVPKIAARTTDNSTTNTFTMEKRGDTWIIVALQ